MSGANHIEYADWLDWLFNRSDGAWVWNDGERRHRWLKNSRLMGEYVVRVHSGPVTAISAYSNAQLGQGLWNLYSSAVDLVPIWRDVPLERTIDAIRSMPALLANAVSDRVGWRDAKDDPLGAAVYMFWDVVPIWPASPTDDHRVLLDVCLEEMQAGLRIGHPSAWYHALHGLGHFALDASERTTPIIDAWLDGNDLLPDDVVQYAQQARAGAVQ